MAWPKNPTESDYRAYRRRVGKHETTKPQAGVNGWKTDREKVKNFADQYEASTGSRPEWENAGGIFSQADERPARWKSAHTHGRSATKRSERTEIRAAIQRAIERGKSDD